MRHLDSIQLRFDLGQPLRVTTQHVTVPEGGGAPAYEPHDTTTLASAKELKAVVGKAITTALGDLEARRAAEHDTAARIAALEAELEGARAELVTLHGQLRDLEAGAPVARPDLEPQPGEVEPQRLVRGISLADESHAVVLRNITTT